LSISIAIPDSLFLEEESLRERTDKTGIIARSASIFGVDRIYIYRDSSRNHDADYEVAKLILEYAETPQYLRKRLIRKRKELDFVGLLPPLRIPSHMKDSRPKINEHREGAVVDQNGVLMADIGSAELARIENGRVHAGQRITALVLGLDPLIVRQADAPKDIYWGFEVRRAPSLSRFLKSASFDLTIMTSRLGEPIEKKWDDFVRSVHNSEKILVVFGSPAQGVDYMLNQDGAKISDFDCMSLNTFPKQNTETIRLEEAVMGFLPILNIAKRISLT